MTRRLSSDAPRYARGSQITRLLFVISLLFTITSCASLPTSMTGDICDIFRSKSHWHKAALKAERKWEIPLHIPMAVMYHESKFRRTAKPRRRLLFGLIPWKRRSSAYGYAQALDGTWDSYRKESKNLSARRTNFADSMDFIGWYISKNSNRNKVAKTDAFHQYIAYHEGWSGYRSDGWRKKRWLTGVAQEVESRAERYASQYRQCAEDLRKPLWRRWLSATGQS